ncbi:MAG: glycosyltransferase [Rubripirellula sp.]
MKILFLHSGDRVPSSRFRVLPYVKHFRQAGHTCTAASSFPQKYDYFPWMGFRPSQLLKRSVRWWHWLRCFVGRYDVVIIDRELFDTDCGSMEQRFRKICKHMILDVDDAVFLKFPDKFEQTVRSCDMVLVGNSFLQEHVRAYNDQTLLLPTCVEMASYPARDWSTESARPVVGWIGTAPNLQYFSVIAEALRNVASQIDFELRLVAPGDEPLNEIDLTGVNIKVIPWNGPTEVQELQRFDIGLMPLFPDQEWDKYKCGLKLIQYMAVGVPGIASPVGVNADIVENGRDGFLCRSTAEWEAALVGLLSDANRRQSVGQAARETASEHYSIEANFPRFRKALEALP